LTSLFNFTSEEESKKDKERDNKEKERITQVINNK
jgi:hypothetical protein